MRRFRYGVDQMLKIIMLAAGGFLILALADKYEKEMGDGQEAAIIWEEYGKEMAVQGLGAIFRYNYPAAKAIEEGKTENGSWEKGIAHWFRNRNPRLRFEQSKKTEENGYGDPDPSFDQYLGSQRVVAESSYLIFGGGEETGTDKADLAGVPVEEIDLANSGQIENEGELVEASELPNLPQATTVHHENEKLPILGTKYVLEQLADYDFLMKHFYSVHSSTTAGREEMDAAKLLGEDLSIEKDAQNPQILIYHTHSQETFADYGENNQEATVVGIGNYLTQLLEEKGYQVIHDTQIYDFVNGELDRSKAYDYALKGITEILQQNPSIEVVLDVHRDGVRQDLHMVSEVNGKPTAPIMFFNGMSQTPEGPIEYLPNGYKEQNLAFSLQMQLDAATYFPGFTRKIYLKAFRYNLHLRPRSALIEVGAQTNTYEEARNAMEPLAELLDMVLNQEEN